MKGIITGREEFIYPDMELGELTEKCELDMAKNGRKGLQILLETEAEDARISLRMEGISCEIYQMRAVPVEYNTGDGVSQGGNMVVDQWEESMREYVTRQAPFYVYDCLIPSDDGVIPAKDGRVACYLCFSTKEHTNHGIYQGELSIQCGETDYTISIQLNVHNVQIPEGTFHISNWFSLSAIRRLHDGYEFYDVLRKYAKAMKRTHQTAFFIQIGPECIQNAENKTFDFEYLTPVIRVFKEEGIDLMEIGPVLGRGVLEDGSPDMYTGKFKCAMFENVEVDTEEGKRITERYVSTLAEYLKRHQWDKQVLIHIHDEPDIHYKTEEDLENRIRQYRSARMLIKKYMPEAKIIEAVGTETFKKDIDILVPVTSCYEKYRKEFERCVEEGKEIWNYVCCGPEGKWLNRFLDYALIKGRILFWGFARYGITGFLHWGFNQFPVQMDPFTGTSCYNPTGIGTNFPCGDAFIVYPGENEPWLSMRLEAQRQGAEDVMLLQMLQKKDERKAEKLIQKIFTSNTEYNEDPGNFESVMKELLVELSGYVE